MDSGALVAACDLFAGAVDDLRARAFVLGADRVQHRTIGEFHGDTVVGFVDLGYLGLRGAVGEVLGVEGLDLAVAVAEEHGGLAVVDDVSGQFGVEDGVGELRVGGVAVGVVAVRLGPDSGVEEAEAFGDGDHEVAAVADGVEAVEALNLRVVDDLERRRVEGEDPSVVGSHDPRLGTGELLGVPFVVLAVCGARGLLVLADRVVVGGVVACLASGEQQRRGDHRRSEHRVVSFHHSHSLVSETRYH